MNQMSDPCGLCVDDDSTIYIADNENHRILAWKIGESSGHVVAGGNGKGNRDDQLNQPNDVIVDQDHDSLLICDWGNDRIVRWPRRGGSRGETIISNVVGSGIAMDYEGFVYVSDVEKAEVRRFKIGETQGTVVAGGNREGHRLNQLNCPTYLFVDRDQSLYVSDRNNSRVMKWIKGAKEGIVVAGGMGEGDGLAQLNSPEGLVVDQFGHIYVAEFWNHRVTCWKKGKKEGIVVAGGNGKGKRNNTLNGPMGLAFDRQNNLYVVDRLNHRIQRFDIDK